MNRILLPLLLLSGVLCQARPLSTPFEQSGGLRSATYAQCLRFYRALDRSSDKISLDSCGPTDAGLPLHVVYYNARNPAGRPLPGQLVILINNGIHPGEPDGIDACMLLLRDAAEGKVLIPEHVVLAVIPVYNIGGMLNRNSYSRVNQDGPEAYGFRGNARNLDLNRDFTKNDSRESRSFGRLFQSLQPAVFIDNHVSDGADYRHTMTLLSTQYDKLGGRLGALMRDSLDPAVYRAMDRRGWPMIPYVNAEDEDPRRGWTAFYDPPRFSAGYAALFHTIAYTPETHMLKPFRQRVASTYDLMRIIIRESGERTAAILQARSDDQAATLHRTEFPLTWIPDTTKAAYYRFLGYAAGHKKSAVTGQQRLYYDRSRPFTAEIPIHDHYTAGRVIRAPEAYVIPQGWYEVTERLAVQGIRMQRLDRDTAMAVTAYHIDDYKTLPRAYEGHYKHADVRVSRQRTRLRFRKGDYLIPMDQPGRRFLIEMLEPEGDDSYFAWNFFDAVLQQKEGYSDYRWEDLAAGYLERHPEVRRALEAEKRRDKAFAQDAAAQLRFVYRHSPWYEPEHLRYPVFRLE